jgi:hypothetical protein
MADRDFFDKIAALHHRLAHAHVPHAFGGAIALAYYAEPRATADIDLNVFVPVEQATSVLRELQALGVDVGDASRRIASEGQSRTFWGRTPVDLFFSNMAFHTEMRRAAREVPGPDGRIPVLSPEHLLVCKALFDRAKDWLDIKQMLLFVPDLRSDEVMRWMREIAGEDDPRTQRVREMIAELLGR